ncbi:MAG: hypothetical protein Q7J12_07890, partial [Syntrophales bacterium]|nr:hypothetical protein [Syntrophales bacterium]
FGRVAQRSHVDTELLDLWKEFYDKEWRQHLGEEWGKMQQSLGQVIPAWKAVTIWRGGQSRLEKIWRKLSEERKRLPWCPVLAAGLCASLYSFSETFSLVIALIRAALALS